jgi:hypothetical protein
MKPVDDRYFCRSLPLALLFIALASFSFAANSPSALTVRESGAGLYAQQDAESGRIATLPKGEALFPIAEAVGREIWYMVKTQRGLFGWVRADEVIVSNQLKDAFREQQVSTWSARSSTGQTYEGNWTSETGQAPDKAAGTWTLSDTTGKIVSHGTWSGQKFATGWNGAWRASVEGQKSELAGSWTADFPQARGATLAELFEAAARDAIRGVWNAGSNSGSWSIRAVK